MLIPYKYSRIAHITSLFPLLNSYYCYINEEYLCTFLLILCYISTNLHWNNLKSNGIIRNIDIFIVLCNFLNSFFTVLKYDCYKFYYFNCVIIIFVFIVNCYLDSIYLYSNKKNNLVYIRSVLVHTIFCHVLQSLNGIYILKYCNKI